MSKLIHKGIGIWMVVSDFHLVYTFCFQYGRFFHTKRKKKTAEIYSEFTCVFTMNSKKKVQPFFKFFYLQNFWTDGSKIHSIFHTSWNSFNMMISFGMSSQEITKLNLHYFPGRRCFDGLFPESGNKAGTIKSLWNADLISREIARKTTCRRNGRSIREGEMECRERKFPLPKLLKEMVIGNSDAPERQNFNHTTALGS